LVAQDTCTLGDGDALLERGAVPLLADAVLEVEDGGGAPEAEGALERRREHWVGRELEPHLESRLRLGVRVLPWAHWSHDEEGDDEVGRTNESDDVDANEDRRDRLQLLEVQYKALEGSAAALLCWLERAVGGRTRSEPATNALTATRRLARAAQTAGRRLRSAYDYLTSQAARLSNPLTLASESLCESLSLAQLSHSPNGRARTHSDATASPPTLPPPASTRTPTTTNAERLCRRLAAASERDRSGSVGPRGQEGGEPREVDVHLIGPVDEDGACRGGAGACRGTKERVKREDEVSCCSRVDRSLRAVPRWRVSEVGM